MNVPKSLLCRGKLIDLSEGAVMGILNITPDSFYDGGNFQTIDQALSQAEKMINEGATFIDIGGCSTKPGSVPPEENEELKRLLPVIEAVIRNFPETIISVDTYRSHVARLAVEAGASIINDVNAGEDAEMLNTVSDLNVPYIMMHKKGNPQTMQENPVYEDVAAEVLGYLTQAVERAVTAGINDIIIDPGFGFGKTLKHNYQLLHKLHLLKILNRPVVAGISRKGMIHKLLKNSPQEALNGTTAVHVLALLQGVDVLRVHDVKEAIEVMKIVKFYREAV